MRVAALYDIHANLPALEAVLAELRGAGVDRIVVGGDVLPGPMPRETMELLLDLDLPTHFLRGNGDLAVLAQLDAGERGEVSYWGTASGAPLPEPVCEDLRWNGRELGARHGEALRSWPATVELEHPALGRVLFCHGTPRSETACFTRRTPEASLRPAFEGLDGVLVVCGHTHMQFDRPIGSTRVVNAGSVGLPFGRAGAEWLLLADDVQLRRTDYDVTRAADRIRATRSPQAVEVARAILHPPTEEQMLAVYTDLPR